MVYVFLVLSLVMSVCYMVFVLELWPIVWGQRRFYKKMSAKKICVLDVMSFVLTVVFYTLMKTYIGNKTGWEIPNCIIGLLGVGALLCINPVISLYQKDFWKDNNIAQKRRYFKCEIVYLMILSFALFYFASNNKNYEFYVRFMFLGLCTIFTTWRVIRYTRYFMKQNTNTTDNVNENNKT